MRSETLQTPGSFRSILLALALVYFSWLASPLAADDQAERVAVGDIAPEISLQSSDSKDHNSSELRGKKNLLLIFFRGTW